MVCDYLNAIFRSVERWYVVIYKPDKPNLKIWVSIMTFEKKSVHFFFQSRQFGLERS